jgi:hypothetical protein
VKLRRRKPSTKLDRRRERSRANLPTRSQAFDALLGVPSSWTSGEHGEVRHWKGRRYVFQDIAGSARGPLVFPGAWFVDKP